MKNLSRTVSALHKPVQGVAKTSRDFIAELCFPLVESLCPSKDETKAWTYYALFATTSYTIHAIGRAYFPTLWWEKKLLEAIVGGLLQGNPDCPNQIAIEKYPMTGFFLGAAEAVCCCVAYSYSKWFLGETLGNMEVLLTTVGLTVLGRKFMCPLEGATKDLAEFAGRVMFSHAQQVGEVNEAMRCCG
jgi:hypothetical protein